MSNRNVQQVVVDLLKIFHETCERQDIPYVLLGSTARAAMLKGSLPGGHLKVEVCVRVGDCPRLAAALNEVDPQRYLCEWWGNNDMLPYMVMRFHDRSTTYMNFKEAHAFIGAGLRVEVIPLRGQAHTDGVEKKRMRTDEYERCAALLPYSSFSHCDARPVGDMRKAPSQKPAAEFFAAYCHDDGEGNYRMWHPEKKCNGFDRRYFDERQLVDFGGAQSYVPVAFEDYMTALGDKYWKDKPLKEVSKESDVWFSADMPYELAVSKFQEAAFPLEKYYEDAECWQTEGVESHVSLTRLNRMRKEIRFVHNQIMIEEYYSPCKQREIMDAFVAGDWERLREEFALYRALMVKSGDSFLDTHVFAMPKPLQIAFIVLAEKDGDHQIALRAWMCFEDAYGAEESRRLERLVKSATGKKPEVM